MNLVISWIYRVSLNYWILSLFFVNGPQTLDVNLSCLKCISDISLLPANKNLLTISFILYFQNKRGPTKGIVLKRIFIPKLLNNPLAFYCLINFDFLLSHTAHFDKRIILLFFVFTTFAFLLSVFFLHFKQYNNIVL